MSRSSKKTHCLRGHLRTPENLWGNGNCKECIKFRISPEYVATRVKTACKNGHARTPENILVSSGCRLCNHVLQKRWADKNRAKLREAYLKDEYGISEEDYKKMYAQQMGLCACCGKWKSVLCVDHDHETKIIRGLLCSVCNRAIGQLGDSLEGVLKAVKYLQRNQNFLEMAA